MRRLALALVGLALPVLALPQSTSTVEALRQRAQTASEEIAQIVQKGPDASDAQLDLMQKLLDELRKINAELKALKGAAPAPKPAVLVGGFFQGQYQSTDRTRARAATGAYDAFRIRRIRLTLDADPRERVHVRASFDTTLGTSQLENRLREGYVRYTVPGAQSTQFTFGQQILPVGSETERSAFDQEMADRTVFAGTYFNGEYGLGLRMSHFLPGGWNFQAGMFNALTAMDAEQIDRNQGSQDQLGGFASVGLDRGDAKIKLSGFAAKRPEYESTSSPQVGRHFLAVDGSLKLPQMPLTLRAEGILGRDRVPGAKGLATPMAAWYGSATYDFDSKNNLTVRYQQLDRNLSSDGNALFAYGLAYTYRFDKDFRLIVSHEIFQDGARVPLGQKRFSETVVRLALKF